MKWCRMQMLEAPGMRAYPAIWWMRTNSKHSPATINEEANSSDQRDSWRSQTGQAKANRKHGQRWLDGGAGKLHKVKWNSEINTSKRVANPNKTASQGVPIGDDGRPATRSSSHTRGCKPQRTKRTGKEAAWDEDYWNWGSVQEQHGCPNDTLHQHSKKMWSSRISYSCCSKPHRKGPQTHQLATSPHHTWIQ